MSEWPAIWIIVAVFAVGFGVCKRLDAILRELRKDKR